MINLVGGFVVEIPFFIIVIMMTFDMDAWWDKLKELSMKQKMGVVSLFMII